MQSRIVDQNLSVKQIQNFQKLFLNWKHMNHESIYTPADAFSVI